MLEGLLRERGHGLGVPRTRSVARLREQDRGEVVARHPAGGIGGDRGAPQRLLVAVVERAHCGERDESGDGSRQQRVPQPRIAREPGDERAHGRDRKHQKRHERDIREVVGHEAVPVRPHVDEPKRWEDRCPVAERAQQHARRAMPSARGCRGGNRHDSGDCGNPERVERRGWPPRVDEAQVDWPQRDHGIEEERPGGDDDPRHRTVRKLRPECAHMGRLHPCGEEAHRDAQQQERHGRRDHAAVLRRPPPTPPLACKQHHRKRDGCGLASHREKEARHAASPCPDADACGAIRAARSQADGPSVNAGLRRIAPAEPHERRCAHREHREGVLALGDPRHALAAHRVHRPQQRDGPRAGHAHAQQHTPEQQRCARVRRPVDDVPAERVGAEEPELEPEHAEQHGVVLRRLARDPRAPRPARVAQHRVHRDVGVVVPHPPRPRQRDVRGRAGQQQDKRLPCGAHA